MKPFRLLLLLALFAVAPRPLAAQEAPAPADTASHARMLAGRVLDYLARRGVSRPDGIFLVRSDAAEGGVRVNFSESNVPDSVMEGVRPLVAEFLERFPPDSFVEVSFRLGKAPHLDGAATASAVARADSARGVERQPRLRNVERVAAAIRQVRSQPHAVPPGAGARPALLRMLIDERGEVILVEVVRRTGVPTFDLYLSAIAYQMRFAPGEVNGQPVRVRAILPLDFTI